MRARWGLAALALGLVVALVVMRWERRPRPNAFMRGAALAQHWGCLGCHGPGGSGGVWNPGSPDKKVPAWSGGTHMMYIEDEREIAEWIRDGKPFRMKERSPGVLQMPAFGKRLDAMEMADLVEYYKAIAAYPREMPEDARRGLDTAKKAGCFGCHGPEGRGGVGNPGSFKGYVPPWDGEDMGELVKGPEELREWIERGTIRRFESNPVARHFLDRALLKMPAYKERLSADEIGDIIAYVNWLRMQ